MCETKVCARCKEEKSEDDFQWKTAIRKQSYCRPCFNAYTVERWNKRKLEAIEYKGGKCLDCGNVFPYFVYDFHHLDPNEKEMGWEKMRKVSKERLYAELDKCVLLCSNCHRIRHYAE